MNIDLTRGRTGGFNINLIDDSMVDTLHRHSELSASNGTPDGVLKLDVSGNVSVGADTDGYDVKFYGATTDYYMLWDESEDKLIINGTIEGFFNSQCYFKMQGSGVQIGFNTGVGGTSGDLALGNSAGKYLSTSQYAAQNAALGAGALQGTSDSSNVIILNLGLGFKSLYSIGHATIGAAYNVALGASSLEALTGGSSNISIGYRAGYLITLGTHNIVIGDTINTSSPTASYELNIGGLFKGNMASGSEELSFEKDKPFYFGELKDASIEYDGTDFVIDPDAQSGGSGGLMLAVSTSQKIGFYGTTPVDQPVTVSDPSGGTTIDSEARTAINALIDRLQEFGLIA